MGIEGWTAVYGSGGIKTSVIAAILRARGYKVLVLHGSVMVRDEQSGAAVPRLVQSQGKLCGGILTAPEGWFISSQLPETSEWNAHAPCGS